MFPLRLAVLARLASCLSTTTTTSTLPGSSSSSKLPAAAVRRLRLKELRELADATAETRELRKERRALERERAPASEVAVVVATFFEFREVVNATAKAEALERLLPRGVLGTVKIATEGVNGGLSMPVGDDARVSEVFEEVLGFSVRLNVDERCTLESPYLTLKVKASRQALADGRVDDDLPLDLGGDCGEAIDAAQWHADLKMEDPPLLLDVRNHYESDLGTFEGATPLGTTQFSETFRKLDDALRHHDTTKPVYMFCTGGIRCVKAAAYAKQHLGLQHVKRLQDGIVGYQRWCHRRPPLTEEEGGNNTSLFRGTNFVFDRRAGEN